MSALLGECRETCPTCPGIGSFNRLNYDNCAYDRRLRESTDPLSYTLSRYKFENCARCTYDGTYYAPFDLVDEESELHNLSRPATRCPERLYNPTCQKSDLCWSTFDKTVPVVYPPDLCPVVCSNIKKMKNPGFVVQQQGFCGMPCNGDGEMQNIPSNESMARRKIKSKMQYKTPRGYSQPIKY